MKGTKRKGANRVRKTATKKRAATKVAAAISSQADAVVSTETVDSGIDAAAESIAVVVQTDDTAQPVVALPATNTVREAVALRTNLLKCVDVEQAVHIDTHAVERIDTAVLQVLVAFVRARNNATRTTQWVNPSESFLAAVHLLGLEKHLNIPTEANAAA